MIKLRISGIHYQVDSKVKRYVRRKIGQLDRYVPKDSRQPMQGQVLLIANNGAASERFVCEVKLSLPHGLLIAREASPTQLYAAIDLAEDKIKAQLFKYKSHRLEQRQRARNVWRRLKRFGSLPRRNRG